MEHHTKHPAREPKVPKQQVVLPQLVAGGDELPHLAHAMVMCQEVEEREEDRGRLLHAQEAVEGPFAVVLDDGLEVGRVAGEALFGYDVLAGVVAFGGAVPEEEAVLEC